MDFTLREIKQCIVFFGTPGISVRIASHVEITFGLVTTSDQMLLSGISFTTPALYFRKTFSHSVAIVIKDSHGVHNLPLDRESMYSFSLDDFIEDNNN